MSNSTICDCGALVGASETVCRSCNRTILKDEQRVLSDGQSPDVVLPEDESIFFQVSVKKFVVLSLLTFGLYEIFWSFSNWLYLERATKKKLIPGMRAWFGLFFVVPLFKEIAGIGSYNSQQRFQHPVAFGVLWIVMSLLAYLPAPIMYVSFFSFLAYLPAVRYILEVNKENGREQYINSKFTVANWVWIVLGSIWWLLVVVGMFLPDKR